MRRFAMLLSLLVLACSQPMQNGEEVIRAMHARYAGKWYKNLTFEQTSSFYRGDSLVQQQLWHEALQLPGKLQIHFGDFAAGNGLIFASDSQYVFQNHKLRARAKTIHPLLLLGFDVYSLSPEQTMAKLTSLGFDLSKMHTASWRGKTAYVVGTAAPDSTATQFWIEKEHLYFVRMIRQNPQTKAVQDIEFAKYQRVGGGWVAAEVRMKQNGRLVMTEAYDQIQAPAALPANLFRLDHFSDVKW